MKSKPKFKIVIDPDETMPESEIILPDNETIPPESGTDEVSDEARNIEGTVLWPEVKPKKAKISKDEISLSQFTYKLRNRRIVKISDFSEVTDLEFYERFKYIPEEIHSLLAGRNVIFKLSE